MSTIGTVAKKVWIPALATCGGTASVVFEVAKLVSHPGSMELEEISRKNLHPMAIHSIEELEREALEGKILPESIIRRYGLPRHFQEISEEAKKGSPSVASEIPAEFRAIAHTLLPIRNGIYANEGRIISFRGLVPLGEQTGNLVVHLGGVFSSRCSEAAIHRLLQEQAECPEFLEMADKVSVLDYEGTTLQALTKRAKEELRL